MFRITLTSCGLEQVPLTTVNLVPQNIGWRHSPHHVFAELVEQSDLQTLPRVQMSAQFPLTPFSVSFFANTKMENQPAIACFHNI